MKKKILLIALICLISVALAVPVCARAATVSSYEIYPNPHVVMYAQTTCKIPRETKIYISDSLDEATVNRAYDAVSQMDVLAYADNEVRSYSFYFGVYGTNDSADKFVKEQMKIIQIKHNGNQEKINQEMMELYKKEKINPFGGCCSIIIQFILLFGMFYLV